MCTKKLNDYFLQLKELIKCPICLNDIEDLIELNCGHRYCSDCFKKYKSTQIQVCCPVCKSTVKRRSVLRKDEVADMLGKFINKVSRHLEAPCSFDKELEEAASIQNQSKKIKGHEDLSVNQPTTSTGRRRSSKDCGGKRKCNEDAFDKLIKARQGSLTFNKKGTRTTYNSNKKSKITEEDLGYKILHFEDDRNKLNVVKWLNDNRNQFDRLTQTQHVLNDDTSVLMSQQDLPSVSQAAKFPRVAGLPRGRYKGRAKSLEAEIKKNQSPKKRHSDGLTDIMDNYVIEEVNAEEEKVVEKAEENVLMNFIEDGYLNKLETEFKCHKKVKIKPKNCTKIKNPTPSCTKVWDRLFEIQKSSDKGDKAPKQLNITLQASQNSSIKSHKINKFNQILLTYEEVIKSGFRAPKPKTNEHENEIDLVNNKPEIRISSNNNRIKKDIKASKVNETSLGVDKITCDKKVLQSTTELEKETSPIPNAISNQEEIIKNMEKSPLPKSDVAGKIAHGKSYDYDTLENYMVKNMLTIQNKDILEYKVTNKNDRIKDRTILNGAIPTTSVETVDLESPTPEPLAIDDDYLKATQKLNTSTDLEVAPNDEVGLHNSPQELDLNNSWPEHVDTLDNLLDTFDEVMKKCIDTNNLVGKQYLHKLKVCFGKIKTLYEQKLTKPTKKIVTPVVTTDIETQTEPTVSRSTGVQTKIILEDASVQTDNKSSRTREIQTECAANTATDAQNSLSENTKLAIESILEESSGGFLEALPTVKKTQTFTATLDNFNFETQEMSVVKRTSPNKNVTGVSQGTRDSVLVCTVTPSNRKLVSGREEANVSKRLKEDESNVSKRPREEYSDEIICPPIKRNMLIRNDLSVKFESQMTEKAKDNDPMSGTDSDSIDYDNYLVEVMRKYDEGNLFSAAAESKQKIDKPVKEPVLECDDVAATVSRNIENLSKAKKLRSSSSNESFKTASSEDLDKNIDDIMKMCNQSEVVGTESCDIIGKTESIEPFPKRLKKGVGKVVVEKPEDCQHLNNSLDDAEFETSPSKIHILSDIKLHIPDERDDDLFSDDDIVETTPQKEKRFEKFNLTNVSLLSQFKNAREQNDDCIDVDFAPLPPPPDFQDAFEGDSNTNAAASNDQTTVIDMDSTKCVNQPFKARVNALSLTPDDLSPYIRSEKFVADQSPARVTKRRCQTPEQADDDGVHNTPVSVRRLGTETLGFSPITADKSVLDSRTSRHNPNKGNILTSTPKQKSIWNYVKTSQPEPLPPRPKPCIACTRLGKDQVMSISQLTNKKLASYRTTFDANVTHMIVSVDENNCLKDYTMKSMAAIAAGMWVLRFGWIQECLNTNSIVDEEPYEVLDDTGQPGPRTSRLTRRTKPLLAGYKFFCADPFFSTTRKDLEDIIETLGGKILPNPQSLAANDDRIGLIITEGRATQDFEIYESWLEKYKVVTVDIEWLSKSVARYKLLSIRPYVWCTDDCLDDMNYPAYLIEYTALTVSEV